MVLAVLHKCFFKPDISLRMFSNYRMDIMSGLKILDLSSVLAGPSVGMFFAELGAAVVKVENLTTRGDVTRTWRLKNESNESSISSYFSACNWGKQSIVLDIKKKEGQEIVHRLAAMSDIVIASYKPGAAAELNVDYDTLRKLNPSLIYASITGYGQSDNRAGYDGVIQAESGFQFMNGEPPPIGGPTKMPVALMDILAAHQLKEALLLALWRRDRGGVGDSSAASEFAESEASAQESGGTVAENTASGGRGRGSRGLGAEVHVSLLSAGVSALANQASGFLQVGAVPARIGSEHPNIAPFGTVFQAADGEQLVVAVGTDRQFASLCDVLQIALPHEQPARLSPMEKPVLTGNSEGFCGTCTASAAPALAAALSPPPAPPAATAGVTKAVGLVSCTPAPVAVGPGNLSVCTLPVGILAELRTNRGRVRHRAVLRDLLQSAIGLRQRRDVLTALAAVDVPVGAVNSMPAVFQQPAARRLVLAAAPPVTPPLATAEDAAPGPSAAAPPMAAGDADAFPVVEAAVGGRGGLLAAGVRQVAFDFWPAEAGVAAAGFEAACAPPEELAPPPRYGQHSTSVLVNQLRLQRHEVQELMASGVVHAEPD